MVELALGRAFLADDEHHLACAREYLHAMVRVVGHGHIPLRRHGDARRLHQAPRLRARPANAPDKRAVTGEDLNAAVALISHHNVLVAARALHRPNRADGHAARHVELSVGVALLTKLVHELAV
eukprot:scaffold3808_cov112-Isochrysis_galbana.AAC.19